MTAMTLVLDQREWTRAERDALPDDGSRYELLDGTLLVTPSPRLPHQAASGNLYLALRLACPAQFRVFHAPLDITLDERTVLEPDLVVLRREQTQGAVAEGVPELVVEILSPSTRLVDVNLKMPRFARAGCPSFWLVDLDIPAVTAYALDAGTYRQIFHVTGEQRWYAEAPFPVTIVPARLLD